MELDKTFILGLRDLSLAEVFRKLVLEDPGVVAAGNKVIAETGRHSAVFQEGQTPGFFVEHSWCLSDTAENLAFQFVHIPISFVGEPAPVAPPVIVAAAEALTQRLQLLNEILKRGALIAKGTYCVTGVIGEISRFQWTRTGVLVDVQNSDLVERAGSKTEPKWTGIWLEVPQNSAPKSDADQRKATARVESSGIALRDCTSWLAVAMAASPTVRQGSKNDWWEKAKIKWPKTLSRRGFDSAWTDAVSKSKASAWAAAGAPRKSSR